MDLQGADVSSMAVISREPSQVAGLHVAVTAPHGRCSLNSSTAPRISSRLCLVASVREQLQQHHHNHQSASELLLAHSPPVDCPPPFQREAMNTVSSTLQLTALPYQLWSLRLQTEIPQEKTVQKTPQTPQTTNTNAKRNKGRHEKQERPNKMRKHQQRTNVSRARQVNCHPKN